jgi:nucleoside-diphosphate-sugar epimerase
VEATRGWRAGVRAGHAHQMTRVVVTGGAGRLGARVVRLLTSRDDAPEVIGIDLVSCNPGGVNHQIDLLTADLDDVFAGADSVLHLASVFGAAIEGPEIDTAVEVAVTRRVLEAAGRAGVDHIVVMSSATVYGPWANNPVPLTEEAPLRPHPDLALAVQKAEIERMVGEWSADHPGAIAALLRPVTVVADGVGGWLAKALHASAALPANEETPIQYLHIDDLASAVVAVWAALVDGPVNVAPDGWLTPTERRALDPVPKVRLPESVALGVADWRWRLRLAPTAPGVLAYARHPWVVANDRLTATGWTASNSNEEAYVAGHQARAIETISPQRRQELALGVVAATVAAAGAGVAALIRNRRHSS